MKTQTGIEIKSIPNVPDYYAGEDGHIYTNRKRANGRKPHDFSVFRQVKECMGLGLRVQVGVIVNGRGFGLCVGRAVAAAWHGPPPPDRPWVLHVDDNRWDNRPSKLYYGTPKQNAEDSVKNGHTLKGAAVNTAKLTDAKVRQMRKLRAENQLTTTELVSKFGVCRSSVKYILAGTTWKHVK
jgi:hypothetical protein